MTYKIVIPFILLSLFSLADLTFTNYLIAHEGFKIEANPILRFMMESVDSTLPMIVMKVITLALYGAVLYNIFTVNTHLASVMIVATSTLAIIQFGICLLGLRMVLIANHIV